MPRVFATLFFPLSFCIEFHFFPFSAYSRTNIHTFSHTEQIRTLQCFPFCRKGNNFRVAFRRCVFFSVSVGRRFANEYSICQAEHKEIQKFQDEYSCRFPCATLLRKICITSKNHLDFFVWKNFSLEKGRHGRTIARAIQFQMKWNSKLKENKNNQQQREEER